MVEISYSDLDELSKPGMLVLINSTDKRVFIGSSKNLLATLGRLMDDIKSGKHPNHLLVADKEKLIARLSISNNTEDELMKYEKLELAKSYKDQGYIMYNSIELPTYRPVVRYDKKKRNVNVLLCSKGYSYRHIKSFNNKVEANEYIKNTSIYQMLLDGIEERKKDLTTIK